MRVLRPGGTLVVIDNDQVNGEFAELLAVSSAGEAQGYEDYIGNGGHPKGPTPLP